MSIKIAIIFLAAVLMWACTSRADSKLSAKNIEYISNLLGNRPLSSKMQCTVKARKHQMVRSSLDGSQWVEYLAVDMSTDLLGPRETSVSLVPGMKFTKTKTTLSSFGPVEEIEVELLDKRSSWLRLVHNGSDVLDFEIGSQYGIYPCKPLEGGVFSGN